MRLSQDLGKREGLAGKPAGPTGAPWTLAHGSSGAGAIASLSLVAFDLLTDGRGSGCSAPGQGFGICPAHGTVGVLYPSSIFQSTPGIDRDDHLDTTSSRREWPKIQKGPGPTFR